MFLRSSSHGQTRHTHAFRDDACELTLESSFDGSMHWEPVMQGRYRRMA